MTPPHIEHLRIKESLRTPNGEERFLRRIDGYDMGLLADQQLVRILHVRSDETYYVPLSNVVWFQLTPTTDEPPKDDAGKAAPRTRKTI